MSLRRPASGRRVGAGMLRVDAVRAIAKLRDYQLSEPTAWVLEAIRAAVASGATSIALQGDSNDVWLSWQGEPWPAEVLPALLDELVSPASAREGQRIRLLGTAVNSALGLRPAYIDVYRIEDGKAERVRYMASLLEEQDDDATVLARPSLEAVGIPKEAGDAAMFIHFRRRFGLEPLRNLLQGQPPEMRLARATCGDLPVPIRIGGEEIGAHRNHSDLIRIAIGNDIDGFLALLHPDRAHPSGQAMMHVAEHGVHIASYALNLQESELRSSPPIRFFINAERMPTNASRSEVRRGAHPISSAEKQLSALFAALCDETVKQQAPEAETLEARRAQLRHASLSLLAAFIAGHGWPKRARILRPPLNKLAALPLLKNALGEPRTLRRSWDEEIVYTEEEPLTSDMRPWFEQVLWMPKGDPAALLVTQAGNATLLRGRLRAARKVLKARKRFEAHDAREPRFERVPKHWVRAPLAAPLEGTAAAPGHHLFDGEVYLAPKTRGATITLLLEGRELEEVEVNFSQLPFRAIVTAPVLTPGLDYRSVLRNSYYRSVEAYVLSAAVRCVEALCQDGAEHFYVHRAPSPNELRALVQAAIETVWKLGYPIDKRSPLANFAAWELASGGWASLSDLREHTAVGVIASADMQRSAPPTRATLVLNRGQQLYLQELLEPSTTVVRYAPGKTTLDARAANAIARQLCSEEEGVAAMAIEEGDCRGAIAWGIEATSLRISHRSRPLATYLVPTNVAGATISMDSDAVVPNADWSGLRDEAGLPSRDYSSWQTTLVRAFAMALIGRPPKEFFSSAAASLNTDAGKTFLSLLLDADELAELLGETYEALRAAPIFSVPGGTLVSAEDLAAAYPDSIEYIAAGPTVSIGGDDWQPLLASRPVAALAARLADRGFRDSAKKLERRIAEGVRRDKLATHRQKSPESQEALLKHCPSVVEFSSSIASGLVGIHPTTSPTQIDLILLFEERHFFHSQTPSQLPIIAALEIHPDYIDANFESVKPAALQTLANEILAVAPRLLEQRLKLESTALATDSTFLRFCGLWLQSGNVQESEIQKIRELVSFYDQRGQPMALGDAKDDAFLKISTYEARPWVEAGEGEAPAEWDEPILSTSEDLVIPLTPILADLCNNILVQDMSDHLRTLQIARRIAQGLLLAPKVAVDAALKRSLTDLIASEKIGEIGFREGNDSQVRVYDQGQEKARTTLSLLPAVVIAIEDPSLLEKGELKASVAALSQHAELTQHAESLRQRAIALMGELTNSVLASEVELPEWLRHQFVRALCQGMLSAKEFPALASRDLFSTTRGNRVSWNELSVQAGQFGTVWHVLSGDTRHPLDSFRIAITLPPEIRMVMTGELPFVAAEEELALDEISRENQARPPLEALVLNGEQAMAAIASTTITDQAGLRCIVAPLHPHAHDLRGVHAHRDLKFIGNASDPCTWPTLAVLTDPGISPNRSWRAPVKDERWEAIAAEIVKASDHALVKLIPPPKGMLTSHWVGRSVESREPNYKKRGFSVRGRLWLAKSTESGSIQIKYQGGEVIYYPRVLISRNLLFPLPIHGELLCHPPPDHRQEEIVQEIVDLVYPRLLRQAANLKLSELDSRAAHVALGLATNYMDVEGAKKIEFPCFAPGEMSAQALVALAESDTPIAMRERDSLAAAPKSLAFLRDDSELSAAIERLFAGRLFDMAMPSQEALDSDAELQDATPIMPSQAVVAPRAPIHVLDSLAHELEQGLARHDLHTVYAAVRIEHQRSSPMLAYEFGDLVLAGKGKALLALQAQRIEGDPSHESAVDLLVAHALTVLNRGRTSVTDSTEQHALVSLMRPQS